MPPSPSSPPPSDVPQPGASERIGNPERDWAERDAQRRALRAVYGSTHCAVASTWLVGLIATVMLAAWLAPEALTWLLVIGVGSGVIAHGALIPGSWIVRRKGTRRAGEAATSGSAKTVSTEPAHYDAMVAWLAGTFIRLLGTVALVAWCRYQMAEPSREGLLLGAALGWYVVLTGVEVGVLARALPRLDQTLHGDLPGRFESQRTFSES